MKKKLDERLSEVKKENVHSGRLRKGEPKDRTAVRKSKLKDFLEKEGNGEP